MTRRSLKSRELESIRFGEFCLSLHPLALSKLGTPISLRLLPLRLLAFLASRHGRLTAHEEIHKHLWGNRVLSFNKSVHVYISQIRAALNDDALCPKFIENVPRQGYRFVADVEKIWRASDFIAARENASISIKRYSVISAAAIIATLAFAVIVEFPTSQVAPVAASDALDSYKRGMYLLERHDSASTEKSIAYFKTALEMDPNLAVAHLGVARAYGRLGKFDQANQSANQALALNERLSEAYVILGLVDLMHDWAWDSALKNFQGALGLDESSAAAHQGIASYYVLRGEVDAGIAHMHRARSLDPASTIIRADFGWYYYFAGQHKKAARTCSEALDLAPEDVSIRHCLIRSLWVAGEHRSALGHIVSFMQESGATKNELNAVIDRDAQDALLAFDQWRLKKYESETSSNVSSAARLAHAAAGAGDFERALAYISIGLEERNPMIPFIAVDPIFRPIALDPQFQQMLLRLGLPRK